MPVLFSGFAILLALLIGAGICEWMGWPFLAQSAQRMLGDALQRNVNLGGDAAELRVYLLGRLRIEAPYLEIGAPTWSNAPHFLLARDASLTLGWGDLWRASRGEALRVRSLRAREVDLVVERQADGRASWQFGTPSPGKPPASLPQIGRLQVDGGRLHYVDAPLAADVLASFALRDGSRAANAASAASGDNTNGFRVDADGRWRGFPVKLRLTSTGVLPWIADDAATSAVPLHLDATVGRAKMMFNGTVTDAIRLTGLQGRFTLSGPSLAAVGDPLGVTLPTTPAFRTDGLLARQGQVWRAVIESATVGASRLSGAFSYDTSGARPLLAGRLSGSKLMLVDLGPAIGGRDRRADAAAPKTVAKPGRVIPDRPFDLPALRAMDANVLVDIADVDLNTSWLEPLQPLRGHLRLTAGVLTLTDLDARTAQGRVGGSVQLDGRAPRALWNADLRWAGVRLERFIHQARAAGKPPYVSGRLQGEAKLAGQGRSTADILASLRGNLRTQLRDGTVSHLAIEAAGIDIAQGLGLLIKGDDALPVTCGVADLAVVDGRLTPRVMVIDTADSAVWVEGSLSLANETLDLRAVVSPKDFSPLTLRTPLHVRGSFAAPEVSLEKAPLGRTIGAAALLAIINPLAALIPFIDMAQPDEAARGAAGCKSLVQRGVASRAVAPGGVRH